MDGNVSKFILGFLIVVTGVQAQYIRWGLTLFVIGFKDSDPCCMGYVKTDASCKVSYDSDGDGPGYPQDLGKTETFSDNSNPSWAKEFTLTSADGAEPFGVLYFDFWDADVDSDDYIGYCEIDMNQLKDATESVITLVTEIIGPDGKEEVNGLLYSTFNKTKLVAGRAKDFKNLTSAI